MKLLFDLIGNKYVAFGLLIFCTFLFLKPSSGHSDHIVNDKVAHATIFFCLFVTWTFFLKKPKTVFLYFLIYGISIEITQYLLPISFHRGFEINDILADTTGLILGYITCRFLIKKGDLS
jgi:VanZ family protein